MTGKLPMHYRRFSQPYKKKEGVCKFKEHEERSKVITLLSLPQSILTSQVNTTILNSIVNTQVNTTIVNSITFMAVM